jgi:hypothetical protein
MEMSPDSERYLLWAGIIAIGILLAVLDRRWIGWCSECLCSPV